MIARGWTWRCATRIASRSRGGWRKPGRGGWCGAREAFVRVAGRERVSMARAARVSSSTDPIADEPDWLHADRFSALPPLLAVHLGAGNAAKRWPARAWKLLVERFLATGWRVVVVGGVDDVPLSSALEPHDCCATGRAA